MSRPRALAWLWTLLIVAGCSIPGRDLPRMILFSADKIVHLTVFAVFAWLWMRATPHVPHRRRALYVLLGGTLFGVFTEVYQGLLPFERSADPFDALADVIGLFFGLAASWMQNKRRKSNDGR